MSKEPVEIKRTGEYYLRRALENDKKGALFDALKLYRKAFENCMDSAEALLLASMAASRIGYTGLAGRYITEAMLRNCPEPDCMCAVGFSLCAQGRKRDAQRIMDLLPLTRGGQAALRRFSDHYHECFRSASSSQRYLTRLDGHTFQKSTRSISNELERPSAAPAGERGHIKHLDDYDKPGAAYRTLRIITTYNPERPLLHAMSVSALRCGLESESVIEGWGKILEADPDDLEAAELIACAKKGSLPEKLSLLEMALQPEHDIKIKQRLETILSETANNKRVLTSAEKGFVFCVCHSGSYPRYKDTIDCILAAEPDERLRKLKYILPLRIDLASYDSVGQTSTATDPYALKYMFLRYGAMPGLTEFSLERLVWQGSFIGGICDYLRDTAGGFVEAELALIIRAFMQNDLLRRMCMFHTDAAQATITALYCEKLQPNIPLKRIMKDFEAPGRSVARAIKLAKNYLI